MKIGKLTKLENVTFTTSVDIVTGKDAVNMLDNDVLNIFQFTGGEGSILIEFDPVDIESVSLHNIVARSSVVIDVYQSYPDKLMTSTTVKTSDFTGFYVENTFTDVETDAETGNLLNEFILGEFILGGITSGTVEAINITFTGPSSSFLSSLGYIWAGDFYDFGCSERIQPADESNDDVTISRTNHPDINDRYEFQSYQVTLSKIDDFAGRRKMFRDLLLTGYGTSRPIIFDEPFFPETPEIFLGILDSPKIGYDIIDSTDTENPFTQQTIGIREVY